MNENRFAVIHGSTEKALLMASITKIRKKNYPGCKAITSTTSTAGQVLNFEVYLLNLVY